MQMHFKKIILNLNFQSSKCGPVDTKKSQPIHANNLDQNLKQRPRFKVKASQPLADETHISKKSEMTFTV